MLLAQPAYAHFSERYSGVEPAYRRSLQLCVCATELRRMLVVVGLRGDRVLSSGGVFSEAASEIEEQEIVRVSYFFSRWQ